jgi:hypothetical protein
MKFVGCENICKIVTFFKNEQSNEEKEGVKRLEILREKKINKERYVCEKGGDLEGCDLCNVRTK